ncbi:MFS transporter [Shewanella sp. ULN5]|uniref:MFS transporter n=1 Tax=Shewanella sp. ULN5 TaxID=2994678 RepID=UPI00273ECCDB|nr:MFS transporter [Shewanella sp. ULN5]MDP5148239.1 MFS transporter [Shewanella sp. ULN5]
MNFINKVGYGIGQMSDGVKQAAFSTFLIFYYNQVLGLSASLAGFAALLALIADAITDPMVGHISDRFESKFGRRHPFMLAGVVPFALAIYLLFAPPQGLNEGQLFGWMIGFAIAVRTALTFFYVPHLSLGAELVNGYHERTSLIGYRVFFTYFGIFLTSAIGFAVFFPPTPEFPNGLLNAASYPDFGLFCAILASIAMLITLLSTRSSIPSLAKAIEPTSKKRTLLSVLEVFRALKIPSFKNLFLVILLFTSLVGVVQTLLVYVATYVFNFGPQYLAGLASSFVIGLLFASYTAQRFAKRFDKRYSLGLCMFLGSVFGFAPITMHFVGFFNTMAVEPKFLFIFIVNGISQIFFIAYMILLDSMLTDVIDENELTTGNREEGLFFAARAFAQKASFGLGALFAGIALDLIKFPKSASPETITPEVVDKLALLGGPIMFFLFVATILISKNYPLTKEKHRLIMEKINTAK